MTSILVCLLAFFYKKNPREYIKLLKIQVELKLCRKNFFNSRFRRNTARLVTQGHTQKEGIDYEEVFASVARIEAIRLFLAYASFIGFMVYQIDVKSAFLYGTIEDEVYICQPLEFEDPDHLDKVYKVVKALYGLHQAPRACDLPLLGVNTPRCDEDRIELMELTVFLLPKVEKVGIRVNIVDLQVFAVRHMLLLLVQKLLLFSLTNWCCSLSAVRSSIDKKKVVVTEATIREALHLDDEEGVECLPNEEIFAELAKMGYEKLSTKLTFYKAFFSCQWNLVRNVDSPSKFYMYPRFLQLMIRKQVVNLSTHTTKYTSPALTQKVFANMRRVGDADENVEEVNAGDDAEGDVSAAHGEVPTVAEEQSIPSPTPPTPPPQPSQDIPLTS
uniref:Putative ribonuclease H-like domain-containing protein n=1 Tax=Tanacetum cinerariifolium TaxID=118510 RepID=A0A699HXJ0_TANCI|nr:putative ribonuclease H-like domain-containing protein [Tanacetum cinerariifolium]